MIFEEQPTQYEVTLHSAICIYSTTHPIFTDGSSFQHNKIIVIHVRHDNNISKIFCFFLQLNIHFLSCMLSKSQFKRYLIISTMKFIIKPTTIELQVPKLMSLTSATKKRATTFEDLIRLCCIQDFLTAIRSAKWLPAERIPTKSSTCSSGSGGAFHLLEKSRCRCGAKLGCDEGKEAANTEWISTSPITDSPVASSRVNPC